MQPNHLKLGKDIHRLDNRIRRHLQQTTQSLGLELDAVTGGNGRIIRFLSEHEDRDVLQKDLEDEFGITRSTASRVLRLMEQKGFIERHSVPQDARLKKLVLTARGREISAVMRQNGAAMDARLLSGFTPQEEQLLYSFLDRMLHNLD